MKCPQCGAEVREGKFCNYCGASLPDDTKRVEVKIDKRIEDVAEVRRAEYEAKESELRQKKMKKELRQGKVLKFFGITIGVGFAMILLCGPILNSGVGVGIGVGMVSLGGLALVIALEIRGK